MQLAIFRFSYPDPTAQAICGALAPEAAGDGPDVPKARAETTLESPALVIRIEADDIAALRAAVNSYLRWIDAAERATRVAGR